MADLGPLFYVCIKGKASGPYSGDQLREMVTRGALNAEDAIHRVVGTPLVRSKWGGAGSIRSS